LRIGGGRWKVGRERRGWKTASNAAGRNLRGWMEWMKEGRKEKGWKWARAE